ncbi:ABC transporter substrate-binding protein [Salipaludibacillus agaradhaerens]|uniref:ABC transporter substrate-binding protein n=1 Tax=Salipaludibacillus agaradhaerens TaxID=76935 RepID=UPI002151118C|nr:ABC transporter substrate-binding protein [Salipaludibacillus agaradhaerens]MCR6106071.1 ABC transporter substrate-binding protein [Salipaludibacillus agaradhaerens]MCR6118104.1 ABC transporter substrate-binding protein [Salipaludibacillus agaradhaerens]
MLKHTINQVMIIFAIFILVTGCGENASTTNNNTQNNSSETGTRQFEHLMGETTIPTDPQRIVTLQYTGEVLALDVKPVGIWSRHLENRYYTDVLADVEDVGLDASLEKILELKPDLIIGDNQHEDIYNELEKIAPTILIGWEDFTMEEHLYIVADALGKTAEAELFLNQLESLAAEKSEDLQNYISPDETLLILRIRPDRFEAYGDRNIGYVFYNSLALTPPEQIQQEIENASDGFFNSQSISLEVLPEYKADHMIVMVEDINDPENGLFDLKDTQIWSQLPAVQNDQVYYIERDPWLFLDPISIQGQLEDAILLFNDNH